MGPLLSRHLDLIRQITEGYENRIGAEEVQTRTAHISPGWTCQDIAFERRGNESESLRCREREQPLLEVLEYAPRSNLAESTMLSTGCAPSLDTSRPLSGAREEHIKTLESFGRVEAAGGRGRSQFHIHEYQNMSEYVLSDRGLDLRACKTRPPSHGKYRVRREGSQTCPQK